MSRAFIFDMDGTLFQTDKVLALSLEETFNDLSAQHLWEKETPLDQFREIMGATLPVVWKTLLPNHSNDIREKANEYFHKKLIEQINNGKGSLYPNVEELFTYLKNNHYAIFIASNGQIEYLSTIVKYYGLHNWVTEVFSIQQIDSQNKADLVQTIMEKYKIVKGAVVGDRLSDIKAAKSNGLAAIGCRFDFAQEDELLHADLIIDDLLEVKNHMSLF
ncbi:HAD hydrolase-like protein [Bacillus sp. Bva_UNVM-123]